MGIRESINFGFQNPKIGLVELWRRYKERQQPPYDESGINIHERDWDILLIFDACRFDVFSDCIDINGDLSKVHSRGSTSKEWVRGNFSEGEYGDLVVIATNPFYKQLAEEIDIQVHHFEWVEPTNSETGLTPPDKITDRVLTLAEEFPQKRILAHYMQPHAPYLGPSGENISYTKGQLHRVVKDNSISKSAIRSAYYENLEIVLESIKPIIKNEYGKTVISADHGEMLGESLVGKIDFLSYYGHPYGLQKDCVRSVPWHIIDYDVDDRRDVNESNAYPINSEDVTEQLQALGYL